MKLKELPPYTTDQMSELIDQHIHKILYRAVLKLKLLDGMTYEEVAEEVGLSVQQTKTIVYKCMQTLIKYL